MGKIIALLLRFKSIIGLFVFTSIIVCMLWTLFQASSALFSYFYLNEKTKAEILQFDVVEIAENAFAVKADYVFEVLGKSYVSHAPILDTIYLNEYAARPHINEISQNDFYVWYHKGNPEISTLYKAFPTKKLIYAVLMLLLTFYFISIRKILPKVAS